MDIVISTNILPEEINTKKITNYKVCATLSEFEAHVSEAPRIYNSLYVDDLSVAFNPSALNIFYKILTNGFINLDTVYYITTQNKNDAIQVFQNIFKEVNFEIVDVKVIDTATVTGVVNGSLSGSEEISYSVINKVKLEDYIKNKGKLEVNENEIIVDDSLVNIQERLEKKREKNIIHIIDFDRYYTVYYLITLFNILKVNSKVFTMEFNKYNFLSDYIVKLKSVKYTTDINAISSNESCLFLNNDYSNADYESLFGYLFNITDFDYYLHVIDSDRVTINIHNSHYVLNPVVDNVVRLLEILYSSNARKIELVLIYKGYFGINELTPTQVKQIINQNTKTEVNITTLIIKEGRR